MSRTFRKRDGYIPAYLLIKTKFEYSEDFRVIIRTYIKGAELKRVLNRFHSDAGDGPNWISGRPRWWRNMYERKDRRYTNILLQKAKTDLLFEVILREKPRLEYFY